MTFPIPIDVSIYRICKMSTMQSISSTYVQFFSQNIACSITTWSLYLRLRCYKFLKVMYTVIGTVQIIERKLIVLLYRLLWLTYPWLMSHYLRHCLLCEIHRCKHQACLELQLTLHTTLELHDVQEFKKYCITYILSQKENNSNSHTGLECH